MSATSKTSNSPSDGSLVIEVKYLPIGSVVPNLRNARKHSQRQIVALKAAINQFGFTNPILIDENSEIIAGHGRLEAARALYMTMVPTVRLEHLTPAQKKALAVADNKMSDLSEFDPKLLADQLGELCAIDFPVELTGFVTAEIDILLDLPGCAIEDSADAVAVQPPDLPAVSRQGDQWQLGEHRLLVADALAEESYVQLLGNDHAAMVFADPPYNVPIQGHVSGLGKTQHREFAMASGEMSTEQFVSFLGTYMKHVARFSTDGSIHFHCVDWRHVGDMIRAGSPIYTEFKNLCVWDKTNAGMGSLYRSKHELVLVYKNGDAPHINNVNLGRDGRYRTNVWTYAGANSFGRNRDADLAAHPTVKPVALLADAIRDCSRRGDIILDPFAGSGTILLAAERTGRRAAAIELDPSYVDTAIRRWQSATGRPVTLRASGMTFEEVRLQRLGNPETDTNEVPADE